MTVIPQPKILDQALNVPLHIPKAPSRPAHPLNYGPPVAHRGGGGGRKPHTGMQGVCTATGVLFVCGGIQMWGHSQRAAIETSGKEVGAQPGAVDMVCTPCMLSEGQLWV